MFQTFHLNRLRVFCGAHAKQTVLFECGGIRPALLHLENVKEKSYGGRQFLPAKIWVSLPYYVMKKNKHLWFAGPYPWLFAAIAFSLPSINYFIKRDMVGGILFLIAAFLSLINFIGRLKK